MKIERTIKGEKFRYHVQLIPNKMKAIVKWWSIDEGVEGVITEDFKYILLPNTFTQRTMNGTVIVNKLKLNRSQQWDAKDYNPNHLTIKPKP